MNRTITTLTSADSNALLMSLLVRTGSETKMRNGVRNYCMAVLMLDAGLRVGELVKLRVEQLYFAGSPAGALTLEESQTKTKQQRTVPLTIRCHNAIVTMQNKWWFGPTGHHHFYAFRQGAGANPLTTRQVQRIIGAAARKSLGQGIHPHILRHTFATRLMTKCPMRVVQQLLGHAKLSSTQIYTHPNSTDLQTAIETLNEPTE